MTIRIPCLPGLIEYSFRLFGVWPGSPNIIGRIYLWPRYSIILYQYYSVICDRDDLADFVNDCNTINVQTVFFIKTAIIFLQRRHLGEILKILAEDWRNVKTAREKGIMLGYAKRGRVLFYLMAFFIVSTGVIFLSEALYFYLAKSVEERVFITKLMRPIGIKESPFYELIFVIQYHLFVDGCIGYAVTEGFLLISVLHLEGQVQLLSEQILLTPKLLSAANSKAESKHIFQKIIRKHQRIIYVSERIESTFTVTCFTHFFMGSICICVMGFVLITTLNTSDVVSLLKIVIFLAATFLAAFTVCMAGESLLTQSADLSEAIYSCHWYGLAPWESKMFALLLLRSQKSLHLTAAKFVILSYEKYSDMLKTSVSYFSVLKAAY